MVAVEAVGRVIHGDDLLREKTRRSRPLALFRPRHDVRVTGIGRIHIVISFDAVRVEVGVEFEKLRLRVRVALAARNRQTVVEQEQVAGAREAFLDPLNVVVAAHLLVARELLKRPVLLRVVRILALAVIRGIAETVQEVAGFAGGEPQALGRIPCHERTVMIDNIELMSPVGADGEVAGLGVVVDTVTCR